MRPNSANPEQKTSSLLTANENEAVFQMLGNRCQAISTTVIQLFTTDGPNNNEWHKRCFGILCLVKDNPRKSYFFRLYCLTRKRMVWEHEIYKGMDYMAPQNFLHIFEAEDCVVAFNFASEEEAAHMRNVILEKQKRLERRHRSSNTPSRHSSTPGPERERSKAPQHSMTNGKQPLPAEPRSTRSASVGQNSNRKRETRRRGGGKITKADISMPSDFMHVTHVGFDPERGWDTSDISNNPELKVFLEKAGVSQSQLEDHETRDFIYDFISKNGGLDRAKEEAHLPPPTVPPRYPSSKAPPPSRRPPPPTPPREHHMPPPVPSLETLPSRVTNSHETTSTMKIPPPPPNPPPMMVPPPPPLASPLLPNSGASPPILSPVSHGDPKSNLLSEIHRGIKLKPVDPESKKPTSVGRGDLLRQIEVGVALKPVDENPLPEPKFQPGKPNSMAESLNIALRERAKRWGEDSDESSRSDFEEYDDHEWD